MDAASEFKATTHIVAHLLREVESSMRDVLRPLAAITEELCEACGKPVTKEQCVCGRPKGLITKRIEINAILTALGCDEKDPLRVAWVDANKSHKYAHRDSLEGPRPADSEFEEYSSQIEKVLEGVLDRFESSFANVFGKLDALIASTAPKGSDVKLLKSSFPNNQTIREYFFNNLKDSAWLPLLTAEEFFKKAPNPIYSADGGVHHPHWPPAGYLRRMAATHPSEVAKILNDLEETENEVAKNAVLEIAINLPGAERATLMPRLSKWI
jgi:hypothetical protein